MPFDAGYQVETPAIVSPIDRLINALRGPEPSWWNFSKCATCAIEVGYRAGFDKWSVTANGLVLFGEVHFGMSETQHYTIFGPGLYRSDDRAVRPRHVAAALEHYRDHGEALSPFHFVKAERGA